MLNWLREEVGVWSEFFGSAAESLPKSWAVGAMLGGLVLLADVVSSIVRGYMTGRYSAVYIGSFEFGHAAVFYSAFGLLLIAISLRRLRKPKV
jgi:CHASE2 domain-containing sensor protein